MCCGDIISANYFDRLELRENTVVISWNMNFTLIFVKYGFYLSNVPSILSKWLFLDWLEITLTGELLIITEYGEDGNKKF